MLISYFIAGMLVLIPFFLTKTPKLYFSVGIATIILFIAGYATAELSDYGHVWTNAFETAVLGLVAVGVGYASGFITIKK